MIKDKKKFCDDLKDFFAKQGLTQQNIADRLGVSQQYIASILNGANPIGKKMAHSLSDAFGLSEPWLLTGEGSIVSSPIAVQYNENGDNNNGNGYVVNKCDSVFIEQLKKKDEHIDRLLRIIENMQNESSSK